VVGQRDLSPLGAAQLKSNTLLIGSSDLNLEEQARPRNRFQGRGVCVLLAVSQYSPMQIAYVDGPRFRRALVAACGYAQLQRGELNRINVFPVPDGDTGTNLALTVRAISDRLQTSDSRELAVVAHEAAQAAVLGARGNCGMMLSHFLLGFSCAVEGQARIDTDAFGWALDAGVKRLYESLDAPVEGTILTVMRDTADAAEESRLHDFAQLLDYILEMAQASLERTPDLLPSLKRAGVVDAGAKGFVALLEGVVRFLNGDPLTAPEDAFEFEPPAVVAVDYPEREERYRFCTEALVRGEGLPEQKEVRRVLVEHGDSLIVIRSEDILKIHVHSDEPEVVFDYLRSLGSLVTHKAEDMEAQHQAVGRAAASHVSLARRPVGVLTDSAANLPEEIVRAHGIQVVPLMLVDETRALRDGIDMTAEEFHAQLAGDDAVLTTSQPPPGAFLEGFKRAAEDSEQVVAVLLGSALSGTLNSAEAAAKIAEDLSITIVDTLGISILQGLLVLKATELAELATPPEEIAAEILRIRQNSGIFFTLDSLDRLVASGRVSKGKAWLGSVLNIKPVLEVTTEGVIAPVANVVGRSRVIGELLSRVAEGVPDGARVRFGIIHVGFPEIIDVIATRLRERYGEDVEIITAPATPVIATHLGIGAWGVGYMVES
jgi:DegV family protein with EDD domain